MINTSRELNNMCASRDAIKTLQNNCVQLNLSTEQIHSLLEIKDKVKALLRQIEHDNHTLLI